MAIRFVLRVQQASIAHTGIGNTHKGKTILVSIQGLSCMWKGMYCTVYSIMYTAGELSNSVVWIVVRKAFDNIANTI